VNLVQRAIAAGRALPGRLIPGLDERVWNRQRDSWCDERAQSAAYLQAVGADCIDPTGDPVRVVVVPMDGPDVPDWTPAGGSHFYEIWQAARELFGADQVDLFAVASDEPPSEWHGRLIRHLQRVRATHLVFQVEHDPNQPESYSWDLFVQSVSSRWTGVLLGVIYDSAFEWITIAARRLARTSDRFVLVDICQPMDGRLVPGRPEASIVTMAISDLSVATIDRHVEGLPKDLPVSFIGALYPDRVQMLEAIRASGVEVAVNPHRADQTRDFVESRTNQPSYLDYMAGLYRSRATINLSASSSGNGQQLKTRVLEACLVGTVVLTDDEDRTERFWKPGEEYLLFRTPDDLGPLLAALESDPDRRDLIGRRARDRARQLNVMGFWGGIDEGLRARGLQPLITRSA
jgi:hypothetical protein